MKETGHAPQGMEGARIGLYSQVPAGTSPLDAASATPSGGGRPAAASSPDPSPVAGRRTSLAPIVRGGPCLLPPAGAAAIPGKAH